MSFPDNTLAPYDEDEFPDIQLFRTDPEPDEEPEPGHAVQLALRVGYVVVFAAALALLRRFRHAHR